MEELETKLRDIASESGAENFAVTFRDLAGDDRFAVEGEKMFHAASAIKLGMLWTVFRAAEAGKFSLDDRLHVRNRFLSVVDDSPYFMDSSRDGDSEVHRRIGRTMPIGELAKWMIIASSNLATNLLLDFVGLEFAQAELKRFAGVNLRRGVEDHKAYDQGINNELTADGVAELLAAIHHADGVSSRSREGMMEILHEQKFNDMIPAGVPDSARVAHKTGEISSVCHDAGIVFPQGSEPYVLVILTESSAGASTRREAVAKMAGEVHKHYRTEG